MNNKQKYHRKEGKMCQAMSMLITREGSIYWEAGVDSHEDIIDLFKSKDKLLSDNELPSNFIRAEIVPENNDYLNPDGKWIFKFDDKRPDWWNKKFEKLCWGELPKWKKKVYIFNLEEVKNPIYPFKIEPPEITEEVLELLKIWDSIGNSICNSIWVSVGDSIGASIRDSIGDSIGDSVWDSIRDSIGDSVRDSVGGSVRGSIWAYIGSFFKIKKWKYIDYKKEPFNKIKGYPFQSAVDLWKMGLVPSYDGKIWRLYGLKDGKVQVLWEGKINDH